MVEVAIGDREPESIEISPVASVTVMPEESKPETGSEKMIVNSMGSEESIVEPVGPAVDVNVVIVGLMASGVVCMWLVTGMNGN
jgi:hypothetical protein